MTLCGKRIDWKAQQNSNWGRERGCGETSEEWWEQGPKFRRKGSRRKERQLGLIQPGSDVLRQQAQADAAPCSLRLTGLCAWRETLRSKNQTWQLGRSRHHFRISQWTCFCSLRAPSALIIKVNYMVCFFIHPPPLLLLAPHRLCCWGGS